MWYALFTQQYGSRKLSRPLRKRLRYVVILCCTDNEITALVGHLVVEGLSKLIAGHSFTCNCNHLRINDFRSPQREVDGLHNRIFLVDSKTQSFISLNLFLLLTDQECSTASPIARFAGSVAQRQSKLFSKYAQNENLHCARSEMRRIVNKFYNHVCGLATFCDMHT